jgi:hypothetical protein
MSDGIRSVQMSMSINKNLVIKLKKYRVGKNIFPGNKAIISSNIHNKFYTKLKRVENGIYWYKRVRAMKTYQ